MLMTGLAGLAGGLANTDAARTGSYGGSTTQSGTNTTTRNLRPEQDATLGPLLEQILQRISNPQASLEPFKTTAREGVNASYAAVPDAIRAKYGNNGNASGKKGKAARVAEVSRAGDLSGLEGQFAQQGVAMQDSGLGLAERLLGQNFGSTSSTSSTGSTSGTQTGPGTALSGAVTGGSSMFASLQALMAALNGGL
jgi:hypothetical protein